MVDRFQRLMRLCVWLSEIYKWFDRLRECGSCFGGSSKHFGGQRERLREVW